MDNKLSIIQWNCQGLQAKYEALKILIHENSPICISLQETMMGHRQTLCPRDYVQYHIDYGEERGSHCGSGLLIRRDISHASIPLQTDLQAVAVQIYLKRKYTVCSVYIPPGNNLNHDLRNDLDNVIRQLPRPFLLLGDFNGRHPIWGDTVSYTRGNIIYPFIEDQEFAVLNTGDPTHFHIQTETFSVIDLSLSSPDCFLDFSWIALDDRMGSDHFPIVINVIDEVSVPRSPRWTLDRANWALFSTLAFLEIKAEDFERLWMMPLTSSVR